MANGKTKIIHDIIREWFEDWDADEGKAPLERLDLIMFENMPACIVVQKEPGVLHVATHPKAAEMQEVLFSPAHSFEAGMRAAYIIHAKWLAKHLCKYVNKGCLPDAEGVTVDKPGPDATRAEVDAYLASLGGPKVEWHDFDGQNCDGPCRGWDGESRRCDCGNRRVCWVEEDGHRRAEAW